MRKTFMLLPIVFGLLLPSLVMAAPSSTDSQTAKLLAKVRQATVKYQDIGVAIADGYNMSAPCEDMMGIHQVNLALAMDLVVNELQPEILLYAPTNKGMRLVGVEYFMVAIGTNGTFTGPWWGMDLPAGWTWIIPAPTLFGRSMDGPMAPHELGLMPWHFDFHVYIWQANPDGIFTVWNPTVKC